MIIRDFDPRWAGIGPDETDPILIVDANTVLAFAIAGKSLQPITRGNGKIVQCGGGVHLIQFPLCHVPYLPGAFLPSRPGVLPVKDILGALIMEFNYNDSTLSRMSCYVKPKNV